MNTFKITFKHKTGKENTLITGFNGTIDDAKKYYVGKYFNFGTDTDYMMKGETVTEV